MKGVSGGVRKVEEGSRNGGIEQRLEFLRKLWGSIFTITIFARETASVGPYFGNSNES